MKKQDLLQSLLSIQKLLETSKKLHESGDFDAFAAAVKARDQMTVLINQVAAVAA